MGIREGLEVRVLYYVIRQCPNFCLFCFFTIHREYEGEVRMTATIGSDAANQGRGLSNAARLRTRAYLPYLFRSHLAFSSLA